ncbi:MAG: hypothetical protein AAF513_01040 [Pseudomonadota bacterium]
MLRSIAALGLGLLIGVAQIASADPISAAPRFTFAGNVDFAVTGGSLRNAPNTTNACSLDASDTALLSGIPVGATIRAAYLYWAGSGPTADNTVTFNGLTTTADRTFSEAFTDFGFNLQFFSGFADVTAQVTGNGSFTFADLTVTNTDLGGGASYCSTQAVLSGWGLAVIYEDSGEPFRVINLFDGFQQFRGSQIQLTPTNFVVPGAPIDGRIGILSWEGDVENSAALNGVSENLIFDGASTAAQSLIDGFNPLNNQFNSTINSLGTNTTYGVDLDTYDISSLLAAGDTSATTTYASGGDLVILSLEIISVTNTPAADVGVTKAAGGTFVAGQNGTFGLIVSNAGPAAATGIVLSDTLDGQFTYAGFNSADANWGCTAIGQVVTCTYGGSIASGVTLPAVDITVSIDPLASGTINNTANVTSTTFDFNSGNDSDTLAIDVLSPNLSTSTKTVLDLNGGAPQPGDRVRYTITINESGSAALTGISVTDAIDPLLTNVVVTNAGGGTDNSTATLIDISNLDVPPNASLVLEFEADIVGSAITGEVIANSADILNPLTAVTTTVDAADLTVGLTAPPASGNKPLYFGAIGGSQNSPTLPMPLSRTPLGSVPSPDRVRIRRQDNDRVWSLVPQLQQDFTLEAADIPVILHLRRNNSTNTRNVRVSVDYSGTSSGFFGCVDVSISSAGVNGLSNTVTREYTFNVPRSDGNCNPIGNAELTLAAGTQLHVRVDNEPTVGPTGQAIFVYPFNNNTPGTSRAVVATSTVINIDDLGLFDAAYPGGAAQTTFGASETIFARAQISDPFGSFDISSVTYELRDPANNIEASGTMPTVFDSGIASIVSEVSYTLPANPLIGTWTLEVTANEGSEGDVSHLAEVSFEVSDPRLEVTKSLTTISDPVSGSTNPKSIPLAMLEYSIAVSNTGASPVDLDTMVVADSLPPQMRLFFGVVPNPVTFVDGSPSSGLTYTFIALGSTSDDIRFSNDGGTTFITPVVDGAGLDATTPRINFIEVSPKGVFAASGGGGDPSFVLRMQMRLD